jgi:hypothetical protein
MKSTREIYRFLKNYSAAVFLFYILVFLVANLIYKGEPNTSFSILVYVLTHRTRILANALTT